MLIVVSRTAITENDVIVTEDIDIIILEAAHDSVFTTMDFNGISTTNFITGSANIQRNILLEIVDTTIAKNNVVVAVIASFADINLIILSATHSNVSATIDFNGINITNSIMCCMDVIRSHLFRIVSRLSLSKQSNTTISKYNVIASAILLASDTNGYRIALVTTHSNVIITRNLDCILITDIVCYCSSRGEILMEIFIIVPCGIHSFISCILNFTIITKHNILAASYRNFVTGKTTNNNAIVTTSCDFIMGTNIEAYRLDGSCTTCDTVSLLFKFTLIVLGDFRMNGFVFLIIA